MANEEDILISVEADTSQATKSLGVLVKQVERVETATTSMQKSVSGISATFSSVSATVIKLNQSFELLSRGFLAIKGTLDKTVGAYIDNVTGLQRLGNTLALVGEKDVKGTIETFQAFAEGLQKTTEAEDDQVISLLSLAKTMGLSNEKAMDMVKVSANLAGALGKDVNEAFGMLQATMAGSARELGRIFPELKNLTEEQLKAGKAAELLATRFGDAGAAMAQTFKGQVNQLKNEVHDIFEDIGQIIFEGFNFEAGIKQIKEAVSEIKATLGELKPLFIATLRNISTVFLNGLNAIVGMVDTFGSLLLRGFAQIISPFGENDLAKTLNTAADELDMRMSQAFSNISDEVSSADTVTLELANSLNKIADNAKKIKAGGPIIPVPSPEEIKRLQDIQKALQDINGKIAESQKTINKETLNQRDAIEANYKIENTLIDAKMAELDAAHLLSAEVKAQYGLYKKNLEVIKEIDKNKAPTSTEEAGAKLRAKPAEIEESTVNKAFGGVAQTLGETFTAGAAKFAGIIGAVLSIADAIADFIPGIVEKFAAVFDKLTDLPARLLSAFSTFGDSVVKFTTDFLPNLFKNLPDMFDRILNDAFLRIGDALVQLFSNLPDIIQKFVDRMPEIIEKFVTSFIEALPKVIMGIIKALPQLFVVIARAYYTFLPTLAAAFIKGIIAGLKGQKINIPVKIDDKGLSKQLKNFKDKLATSASRLFKVEDLNTTFKTPDFQALVDDSIERLRKAHKDFLEQLKEAWDKVLKLLRPIFEFLKTIWDDALKILGNLWEILKQTWNTIIGLIGGLWKMLGQIWDGVITMLKDSWKILGRTWDGIIAALKGVWENLGVVWDGIIALVKGLWAALGQMWDTITYNLRVAWDGIVSALQTVFDKLKGIWDTVIVLLQGLWDTLSKTWDTIVGWIRGAFQPVMDFFSSIGEKISSAFSGVYNFFETLGGKISSAFSGVTDFFSNLGSKFSFEEPEWLKNIANRLKFEEPQWVRDFKDALSKATGGLGGGGGGGGGSTQIGGTLGQLGNAAKKYSPFADGGIVAGTALTGGDSSLNDKILAMLSPGEAIIPRSKMNDPVIRELVAAILGKKMDIPQFNTGGMVGSLGATGTGGMMSQPTAANNSNVVINLDMNIRTSEAIDETYVRNRLMPAVRKELKRASLDGQFVISSKGVQ